MISIKRLSRTLAACAALFTLLAAPAQAQDDERELGWAFEVDLGALRVGGWILVVVGLVLIILGGSFLAID